VCESVSVSVSVCVCVCACEHCIDSKFMEIINLELIRSCYFTQSKSSYKIINRLHLAKTELLYYIQQKMKIKFNIKNYNKKHRHQREREQGRGLSYSPVFSSRGHLQQRAEQMVNLLFYNKPLTCYIYNHGRVYELSSIVELYSDFAMHLIS